MTDAAKARIVDTLNTLPAPSGTDTLGDAGLIRDVNVNAGKARIWLELPQGASAQDAKSLHDVVERQISRIEGVAGVEVLITADKAELLIFVTPRILEEGSSIY